MDNYLLNIDFVKLANQIKTAYPKNCRPHPSFPLWQSYKNNEYVYFDIYNEVEKILNYNEVKKLLNHGGVSFYMHNYSNSGDLGRIIKVVHTLSEIDDEIKLLVDKSNSYIKLEDVKISWFTKLFRYKRLIDKINGINLKIYHRLRGINEVVGVRPPCPPNEYGYG
jgi:hypothetical protein